MNHFAIVLYLVIFGQVVDIGTKYNDAEYCDIVVVVVVRDL